MSSSSSNNKKSTTGTRGSAPSDCPDPDATTTSATGSEFSEDRRSFSDPRTKMVSNIIISPNGDLMRVLAPKLSIPGTTRISSVYGLSDDMKGSLMSEVSDKEEILKYCNSHNVIEERTEVEKEEPLAQNKRFLIIDFGSYYHSPRRVLPAEFTIAEFSIRDGIIDCVSELIDPGGIPLGFFIDVKTEMDRCGYQEPGFTGGTFNALIHCVSHIRRLLQRGKWIDVDEETKIGVQRPASIYVHDEQFTLTQDCLNWLAAKSGVKMEYKLKSLTNLVEVLATEGDQQRCLERLPRKTLLMFKHQAMEILQDTSFTIYDETACEFHRQPDIQHKMLHCTMNRVKGWIFSIFKYISESYGCPRVEGRHFPKLENRPETITVWKAAPGLDRNGRTRWMEVEEKVRKEAFPAVRMLTSREVLRMEAMQELESNEAKARTLSGGLWSSTSKESGGSDTTPTRPSTGIMELIKRAQGLPEFGVINHGQKLDSSDSSTAGPIFSDGADADAAHLKEGESDDPSGAGGAGSNADDFHFKFDQVKLSLPSHLAARVAGAQRGRGAGLGRGRNRFYNLFNPPLSDPPPIDEEAVTRTTPVVVSSSVRTMGPTSSTRSELQVQQQYGPGAGESVHQATAGSRQAVAGSSHREDRKRAPNPLHLPFEVYGGFETDTDITYSEDEESHSELPSDGFSSQFEDEGLGATLSDDDGHDGDGVVVNEQP